MAQEHSALVGGAGYEKRKQANNRTKDSTFDRIWKYYHNSKTKIDLEDWEHDIRLRWEAAWFLLCRAVNQKQVADELEKMFKISQSLAYDDVRNAMQLFSDPRQNIKEAKRIIAETIALKGLEHAEKNGNLDMMDRFLQKYIEINGLKDKGTSGSLEDLIKKLKPTQITLVATKDDLELQAEKLRNDIIQQIEIIDSDEG